MRVVVWECVDTGDYELFSTVETAKRSFTFTNHGIEDATVSFRTELYGSSLRTATMVNFEVMGYIFDKTVHHKPTHL